MRQIKPGVLEIGFEVSGPGKVRVDSPLARLMRRVIRAI
jgi:hypothetical protein